MNIYNELLNHFSALKEQAEKEKNHYIFYNNGIFLTRDRKSDARYPYVKDGMVLWAHSNGKIHLSESDFFLIPETVERATYFSYHSVTYILHTEGIFYFVTLTLNDKKELLIYGKAINETEEEKEIYSSLYFNPMLMHSNYSSVETKWFKKCEIKDDCFKFNTTEDISRDEHLYNQYFFYRNSDHIDSIDNTTSRLVYADSKTGNKDSSLCLLKGRFFEEKEVTCFGDTALGGLIGKTWSKDIKYCTFNGYNIGMIGQTN